MKRVFLLIIFALSNPAIAQTTSNSLKELTKNLFTNSTSLEGYQFIVLMVDNLPITKLEFVKGTKKSDGKYELKMKNILSIRPEVPVSDEKIVANELLAMKTFAPTKTVREENPSGPEEEQLIKVNSLDQNNVIRVSQWFDKRTLFKLKSAIFDETGKPLYFNFYVKLDFDKNVPEKQVEKKRNIRLRDFLKDNNEIKFNKISDIEKFCNLIYQEEVEKEGR